MLDQMLFEVFSGDDAITSHQILRQPLEHRWLEVVDTSGHNGQRLSIAIQRGDAGSVLGIVPSKSELEEIYYVNEWVSSKFHR